MAGAGVGGIGSNPRCTITNGIDFLGGERRSRLLLHLPDRWPRLGLVLDDGEIPLDGEESSDEEAESNGAEHRYRGCIGHEPYEEARNLSAGKNDRDAGGCRNENESGYPEHPMLCTEGYRTSHAHMEEGETRDHEETSLSERRCQP